MPKSQELAQEGTGLRLADVARAALAAEVVSRRMLLERSEGEFLELIELIPSADTFKKKEVRVAVTARAGRATR